MQEMEETPGLIPGSGRSLEKGMATHSSILAWKIPWTEKPGGLHSMKSQRVRHNWTTNTSTFHPVVKQFRTLESYLLEKKYKLCILQ